MPYWFEPEKVSLDVGGTTLTLETGRMAKQSAGSVVVTLGDTVVLVTVNTSKPREGIDFFPLTVDFVEKTSAAGKIPGGFFKREARLSDREILVCRFIDRSIRPLFQDGFRDEVQVTATVLAADGVNPPDIAAFYGASAALSLSGMPFNGPIAAVRGGQGRRPARQQPHLRADEGLDPRADRGGLQGRARDGRGRRGRGQRGRDPGGPPVRPPGSAADHRGPAGAHREGRQAAHDGGRARGPERAGRAHPRAGRAAPLRGGAGPGEEGALRSDRRDREGGRDPAGPRSTGTLRPTSRHWPAVEERQGRAEEAHQGRQGHPARPSQPADARAHPRGEDADRRAGHRRRAADRL